MKGLRITVTNEELHTLADAAREAIDPHDMEGLRYSDATSRLLAGRGVIYPRATKWIMTLHAYEQFMNEHGKRPRENTRARHTLSAEERHLGEWARYQRRFEDRLNAYQIARLEVSTAFEWDPRSATWNARLAACNEHRQRTGQLPRLLNSDPTEFALARWLGRQLRNLQAGRLEDTRTQRLTALLRRPSGPPSGDPGPG